MYGLVAGYHHFYLQPQRWKQYVPQASKYQITWYNNPEDHNSNNHHHRNLNLVLTIYFLKIPIEY